MDPILLRGGEALTLSGNGASSSGAFPPVGRPGGFELYAALESRRDPVRLANSLVCWEKPKMEGRFCLRLKERGSSRSAWRGSSARRSTASSGPRRGGWDCWCWGEWEDDEASEEAWPLFMVAGGDGALQIGRWNCSEKASSPAAEGYGPRGG